MDLPLVKPHGAGYATSLNAQRTVNFYPVLDTSGKRSPSLYGCPGSATWTDLTTDPISNPSSAVTWDTAKNTAAAATFSSGNLTATGSNPTTNIRSTTYRTTGKWYFESLHTYTGASPGVANNCAIGIAPSSIFEFVQADNGVNSAAYYVNSGRVQRNVSIITTVAGNAGPAYSACAFDAGTGKLWIRDVNTGAWIGGGDPAAGTTPTLSGFATATAYAIVGSSESSSLTLNVGKTAFHYAVPSGFLAWDGSNGVSGVGGIVSRIRGALEVNGTAYLVAGNVFCTVTSSGTVARRGVIDTGTEPVTLATNGRQVCVANGSLYVYDITAETFKQVTDLDFSGAATVTAANTYGVFNPPNGGQFFITALSDFTNVDALDFATAEGSPDDLIRVFFNAGTLWLFGAKTTEPWQNVVDDLFPFARVGSTVIQRGIAGKFAVVSCDGAPFFLGDDLLVYRMDGYSPVAVSDEGIEYRLSQLTKTDDCVAMTYDQAGHKFVAFKFPTDGVTLVYDVATGFWHDRSSFGRDWRANCLVKLGNRQLIGDDRTGLLLEIRQDLYTDNGVDLIAQHTLPSVWEDGSHLSHNRVELDVDPGVGINAGTDPLYGLDWSDDGGHSWGSRIYRGAGQLGGFLRRVIFNRLGSAVVRNYRITISAPVKRVILGANIEVKGGGK